MSFAGWFKFKKMIGPASSTPIQYGVWPYRATQPDSWNWPYWGNQMPFQENLQNFFWGNQVPNTNMFVSTPMPGSDPSQANMVGGLRLWPVFTQPNYPQLIPPYSATSQSPMSVAGTSSFLAKMSQLWSSSYGGPS